MNKEKQKMWEHYHKLCEVKRVTPLLFEIAEDDGSRPKKKMFSDWIDHYEELKGEVVKGAKDKLIIEVTKRPDGSFWAHCKELPHLSSRGKTQANALEKLANAIDFEIEVNGNLSDGGWQPMETAPKNCYILVKDRGGSIHTAAWHNNRVSEAYEDNYEWVIKDSYDYGRGMFLNVLYPVGWQPLPK